MTFDVADMERERYALVSEAIRHQAEDRRDLRTRGLAMFSAGAVVVSLAFRNGGNDSDYWLAGALAVFVLLGCVGTILMSPSVTTPLYLVVPRPTEERRRRERSSRTDEADFRPWTQQLEDYFRRNRARSEFRVVLSSLMACLLVLEVALLGAHAVDGWAKAICLVPAAGFLFIYVRVKLGADISVIHGSERILMPRLFLLCRKHQRLHRLAAHLRPWSPIEWLFLVIEDVDAVAVTATFPSEGQDGRSRPVDHRFHWRRNSHSPRPVAKPFDPEQVFALGKIVGNVVESSDGAIHGHSVEVLHHLFGDDLFVHVFQSEADLRRAGEEFPEFLESQGVVRLSLVALQNRVAPFGATILEFFDDGTGEPEPAPPGDDLVGPSYPANPANPSTPAGHRG